MPTGGRSCWRAAAIQAALRDWFAGRGFVEVETADPAGLARQRDPSARLRDRADRRRTATRTPLYLHTSPEFACKKLLAAGEPRIFTFARVFRNRERGPLHHPEFTMLEWYRANEPYEALMEDCAALLAAAAEAAGERSCASRTARADPFAAPERLTVAEAFAQFAGIDLLATLPAATPATATRSPQRRARPASASPATTPGPTSSAACWSSGSSRNLGIGRPTLLDRISVAGGGAGAAAPPTRASPSASSSMPAASSSPTASASSPTRPSSAAASRTRWPRRSARYGERYPIDEDFLAALGADAAGQRHRARLRPAGDAGDRRARASSRCCGRRSPVTTAKASH